MTTLELKAFDVEFVSLFDVEASEFEIKTQTKDEKETTKLAPNGKPVYRTTLKALTVGFEGKEREDKTITLALVEPLDVRAGVRYVLDFSKNVWATPWINDNGKRPQQCYSIIATALTEKPMKIKTPKLNGE